MAANPLEHVSDSGVWVLFERLFGGISIPLYKLHVNIFGHDFRLTKFMVFEVIVALLILAIYVWPGRLAQRGRTEEVPKGPFWNAFEGVLTFIRNEVAKPYIGEHDADRFVPFLWTLFLFILFCNLLGLVPFFSSPTGSLAVTLGCAVVAFGVIHGSGIAKMGPLPYLRAQVPDTGIPWYYGGIFLVVLIFVIEMFGHLIRGFVLGIRLFANMLGGHTVLAVILGFIVMASHAGIAAFAPVTAASVAGVVALSFLELFVAFLQAFIFVFLTALFIGAAVHPEH
jgi:F-type H+-transporting ATPase subunit a